ncbi:MAG: hypothetical protein GX580_16235 [Candidatus Hydrogenedens sp.]|nr:hypothetical protein [Candidatus Hydrogenedentota bacterium]NLF59179.1 hypothetical protein [Candidatus Hydrogenedens sp.]
MAPPCADYRLRLRLLSPLGTPMQSDTLFGHLAWHAAHTGGEGGAAAFLAPFLAGNPPFVLSDAFPAGLLPRPLFPVPFAGVDKMDVARFSEAKRLQKAPFVAAEDFVRLLGAHAAVAPRGDPWVTVETPHAAMDRNTWTTTPGGQFYMTEARVLADGFDAVDIYVRELAEDAAARVAETFRDIAQVGFGRDKSTGHGAFEVLALDPWQGFAAPEGADGFVSLSTCMPAADDPADGRWRLRVKRGYLGEMAGGGNPFKRTMLQLTPGAVFRTAGAPKAWYGRIVPDVAPGMPEAVQCGLALAAPCRWTGHDA